MRDDVRNSLGWRARQLRSAGRFLQTEFARRMRPRQHRISQIVVGQTLGALPLHTLGDRADGLRVDLEALMSAASLAAVGTSAEAIPMKIGPRERCSC
jgi:hypothetical protein